MKENLFTCCVAGCSNNNGPNVDKATLFHFPLHNKTLMKEWLERINAEQHFQPNSNTRVCSSHFEGRYIIRKPDTDRLFLKPESVPSLFLFPRKRRVRSYQRSAAVVKIAVPTRKRKCKEPVVLQMEVDKKELDAHSLNVKKEPPEKDTVKTPVVSVTTVPVSLVPEKVAASIPLIREQPANKPVNLQVPRLGQQTYRLISKKGISSNLSFSTAKEKQPPIIEVIKVEPQEKDFEAIAANCGRNMTSNTVTTTTPISSVRSFVVTVPKPGSTGHPITKTYGSNKPSGMLGSKQDKSTTSVSSSSVSGPSELLSTESSSVSSTMVSILDKYSESSMSSPAKALEYYILSRHAITTQRKVISEMKDKLNKVKTKMNVLLSEKKISPEAVLQLLSQDTFS